MIGDAIVGKEQQLPHGYGVEELPLRPGRRSAMRLLLAVVRSLVQSSRQWPSSAEKRSIPPTAVRRFGYELAGGVVAASLAQGLGHGPNCGVGSQRMITVVVGRPSQSAHQLWAEASAARRTSDA